LGEQGETMSATITTIEVGEDTAEILRARAEASGLSLDAYLRLLAEIEPTSEANADMTAAEIEFILQELERGGESVSPLPANFAREDIYFNHD
jgi:hypothetical protein